MKSSETFIICVSWCTNQGHASSLFFLSFIWITGLHLNLNYVTIQNCLRHMPLSDSRQHHLLDQYQEQGNENASRVDILGGVMTA